MIGINSLQDMLHKVHYTIFSLQLRKQMWLMEKKKVEDSQVDPALPDGHVIMPKADKIRTLQILQEGKFSKILFI